MDFRGLAASSPSADRLTVGLLLLLLQWGMVTAETSGGCESFPCRNGGTCESVGVDYVCYCPGVEPRYTGKDCGELYNACALATCPNCSSIPGSEKYTCHCPAGYGGEDCQTPVANCSSEPCRNNGSCVEVGHGSVCICLPGFGGPLCEEEVNECQSQPCRNGAVCVDMPRAYQCYCVPGFQGSNCEIDINECASRPCENNGTCVNGKDRYECQCLQGFAGVNCEVDIDECESSPCQNGATCFDFVDLYICDCLPGFGGVNCEINVDECASRPCWNTGFCFDMVDSFECDCNNTGYTGNFCEEEILECSSNPCQNNATCQEEVNGYRCLCWPGYQGMHCEVDIDECAEEPCENGGTCLERSDANSYRDGAAFSYSVAEGYVCICLPGFTGETCSVDVDDCEYLPCQNRGTCVDLTNAYHCLCPPGFTGTECEVNIDECQSQPCQNGAWCLDGLAGYTCHCPEIKPGQVSWGGTHCEVALTGCEDHQCKNGATCWPFLEDGNHSYKCNCPPGFRNQHCDEVTTFSLTSDPVFVLVHGPQVDRFQVELRFRTTLPDGVLLYRVFEDGYLSLEIMGGHLTAKAFSRGRALAHVMLPGQVNDGTWHGAQMIAGGNLTLLLIGAGCNDSPCRAEVTNVGPLGALFWTAVGGTPGYLMNSTESGVAFVGCMEDLLIDSMPFLPQQFAQNLTVGLVLGCDRTEWCRYNLCPRHSRCEDLWTRFRCDCHRPYFGDSCEEEYPSWTFGHENTTSHASFVIPARHGPNFTVSFLMRSLKPDGLLFQLRRGSLNYFTVFLKGGAVLVSPLQGAPLIQVVTTGDWVPLAIEARHGILFLQVSGRPTWAGNVPEGTGVSVEKGDVAFIGGLPAGTDAEPWGGHFKGCLQDMRLDDIRLGPLGNTDDDAHLAHYHPNETSNVQPGCRSDDICQSQAIGVALCENGGECTVTWNDFACDCPSNFTGKRCERLVWCSTSPCPPGSRCINLDDGYECLSDATLENDSLEYTGHDPSATVVTSVSMKLRTREENGVLLRASSRGHSISVALRNSSLLLKIRGRNSTETLVFTSEQQLSDGAWHHMRVFMTDLLAVSPQWTVTVDGRTSATSPLTTGHLGLVNEMTVILAENFTGCLGEVRVGGVYLPFVDGRDPPQPTKFLRKEGAVVHLGCSGTPVCLSQPCQNNGTCKDIFGLFECTCAPGWQGQYCQEDVDECAFSPCVRGVCRNLPATYQCECPPGYVGSVCQEDLDNCQGHLCQNGATCQDGVNQYTCVCPLNFTGTFCQWMHPPPRCDHDVQCANGGVCSESEWGANCTCRPGFVGDRCEEEVDGCKSEPCQHGGTCLFRPGGFQCDCEPGFVGQHCETSKREQKEAIPLLMVTIPVACCCLLLAAIGLAFVVLTARRKRQSEGTYSPSQQEVAGARLEMDSVLKVPPEERLI